MKQICLTEMAPHLGLGTVDIQVIAAPAADGAAVLVVVVVVAAVEGRNKIVQDPDFA